MKILYIGQLMEPGAYESLVGSGSASLNPSGQNYHSLLVKALARNNDVTVVSTLKDPNVHQNSRNPVYCYPRKSDGFMEKLYLTKKIKAFCGTLEGIKDTTVFFDALSIRAGKAAQWLKEKRFIKTVAIITDKAENLTGAKSSYCKAVKKNLKNADGFICVTKGLNDYYNIKRKPYLLVGGILNKRPLGEPMFEKGSYLFFGGALYERYGVDSLLNAYLKSGSSIPLVIAGHGPFKEHIEEVAKKNEKVIFLGKVSPQKFHELASYSALNINPRPRDPKLDPYCIPSKLVDYISTGVAILSGPCSPLHEGFENDINWIDEVNENTLLGWLRKHAKNKKTLEGVVPNKGANKIEGMFSLDGVSAKLQDFLANFSSTSSN